MNFTHHNQITLEITKSLMKAINKTYPELELKVDQIYKLISPPPKQDMGDAAFPCFIFAKSLKTSPAALAKAISENFEQTEFIEKSKDFGPYVNFYLNTAKVAQSVLPEILSGAFFKKSITGQAPKTMIEFSQPNTHKELHVGHMRNLCLGDALIKIYRYAGVETVSTTFPGDVGTHVAKCLWFYKFHNKEEVPTENKGAWLGRLYTKGNNLLEEQKGSELEDENRIQLTQILKELHAGAGEYFDLWQETRKWSIELMNKVYSWANVEFDHWYWESDVDASSVSLIKEYLEKGLFKKDQGAVGIDLEEDKLGFCLLLKSDGTGLYATKDIELARRKFEEHDIEKNIYVVDNRQALHFKQVFNILDKMGFENAKNCHHLQYEMVELASGAMSSRKGNIVALQDLIDQMQDKIKEDYLAKYADDWTSQEIETTAKVIAQGAIKYGMTRVDSQKKIVFDMSEWLRLDGDSGPYIQYVYARINSMLKKSDFDETKVDYTQLTMPSEKELLNQLSQFNDNIQTALAQNKTHVLCSYLYTLAKSYNSFYAECPILKEADAVKNLRLALSKAVAESLRVGLSLIGVVAPERM